VCRKGRATSTHSSKRGIISGLNGTKFVATRNCLDARPYVLKQTNNKNDKQHENIASINVQFFGYTISAIKQQCHRFQFVVSGPEIYWLPVHDRIKFKIATMTHKAIYTDNPPYLANLVQWHTPCRTLWYASANLLSVTHCNISFGARGFRSATPDMWNSLPSNIRSCGTVNILPTSKISSFLFNLCHCLVTHLSASDSFTTMALYKSIYLLTYSANNVINESV